MHRLALDVNFALRSLRRRAAVRAVSRRTREIDIRVALGATSRSVIALIVKQMLVSVIAGFLIGTAAATMGSRALAPYVFGVTLHDPVTYLGIVVLLGGVSLVASWLPARQAGRIAPADVLKGK